MSDYIHYAPPPRTPLPLLNIPNFQLPLMSPFQWQEREAHSNQSLPPLNLDDSINNVLCRQSIMERLLKLSILLPRLRTYAIRMPISPSLAPQQPNIQSRIRANITMTPPGANSITEETEEDAFILRMVKRLPLIDSMPGHSLTVERFLENGLIGDDGSLYDLHGYRRRNPDLVFYFLQSPATAPLLREAGRPIRIFHQLSVLPPGLCFSEAAMLPLPPLLRAMHYAWYIYHTVYDRRRDGQHADTIVGEGGNNGYGGLEAMGFTAVDEVRYLQWMHEGREPRDRFVYMMGDLWKLEDAVQRRVWHRARWSDWSFWMHLAVYGRDMAKLDCKIFNHMIKRSPPPPETLVTLPGRLSEILPDRYVLAPRWTMGTLLNHEKTLSLTDVRVLSELKRPPWHLVYRQLPQVERLCLGPTFYEFEDVVIDVRARSMEIESD